VGAGRVLNAMTKARQVSNPNSVYAELMQRAGVEFNLGGASLLDQIRDVAHKDLIGMVNSTSMLMFNSTEKWGRGVSLIAGYDEASVIAKRIAKMEANGESIKGFANKLYKDISDRMGLPLDSEAVKQEFAIKIMERTNFDFSKTGLPEIFRSPAAAPFLQFKTFLTKQLEFMVGKDLTPIERFKVLSGFVVLGGMLGIPGMNTVDAMARMTGQGSPKAWMLEQADKIDKATGLMAGELLAGGLPRIAGIDISQRLVVDDFQFALDTKNILGIVTGKGVDVIKFIAEGRTDKALASATPAFVNSAQKAYQLITGGEVSSRFTGKVLFSEKDLSNPVIQTLALIAGFQPDVLTDFRVKRDAILDRDKRLRRSKKNAKEQTARLFIQGDSKRARAMMKKHGLNNRDVNDTIKRLKEPQKQQLRRRTSLSTRQAVENIDILD
jgi:hypothetical protein